VKQLFNRKKQQCPEGNDLSRFLNSLSRFSGVRRGRSSVEDFDLNVNSVCNWDAFSPEKDSDKEILSGVRPQAPPSIWVPYSGGLSRKVSQGP
jgi:hypothetical protein